MANDKKALLPLIVALVASLLCFCSPLPAFADDAEDDSPAYEVWQQYKDSSVTEYNLYKKVAEDLAYRWFMADDTKRAKVPLQSVALGSYKQLSQYAEDYDTPEEQWQAFYDDFHPSYIVRMYSLVTYEDSLATWSVSDSYAYQHFKEWYEWYSGSSSGSDGPTEQDGLVFIPIEGWDTGYAPVNPHADYVVTTVERWQWLNDGYSNVYFAGYSYAGGTFTGQLMSSNEQLYYFDMLPGATSVSRYTVNRFGSKSTTRPAGKTLGSYNGYMVTVNGIECYDFRTGDKNDYILDGTFNHGGAEAAGWWGSAYMPVTLRMAGSGSDGGGTEEQPTDPVYPEPETPGQPTPSDPVFIDNDITTTTVDLEPILEAIRRLNSNVITGFDTLNENMNAWLENVSDWLDTIWDELRSANAWLERIFYKTGGGSSSGPDITIDGDGWWGWLSTIAGLLLGDLAGAVSGLAGAFDVLRGLFPFSVPWDLAALLGLFASDPVTPVFDLPVPFGFTNGTLQSASVHVDLSAWDNVMVAVRSVELAIFALGLALKTRELLKNAEVEQ